MNYQKITTDLRDYNGDPIIFTAEAADKAILKIGKPLPDLFEALWSSHDDAGRDCNSYNGGFLGRDYLIKWYNGRQYVALHRAGDIRGNYTDFVDVTDSDILDELSSVSASVTVEHDGKKYTSNNKQSFDIFSFDPIPELSLTSGDVEELYFVNS